MTQQFENFVNAALDKSLASDVTLPTANEIPTYTGIGRQVTGKTLGELGIATTSALSGKEPTITAGTSSQYYRGDKSFQTLDTDAVPETATRVYLSPTQKTIATQAASTSKDGYLTSTDWSTFNSKQAALVSGTNIKTLNGNSLLGSDDLSTIPVFTEANFSVAKTGQPTYTVTWVLTALTAAKTWTVPNANINFGNLSSVATTNYNVLSEGHVRCRIEGGQNNTVGGTDNASIMSHRSNLTGTGNTTINCGTTGEVAGTGVTCAGTRNTFINCKYITLAAGATDNTFTNCSNLTVSANTKGCTFINATSVNGDNIPYKSVITGGSYQSCTIKHWLKAETFSDGIPVVAKIVDADATNDRTILRISTGSYANGNSTHEITIRGTGNMNNVGAVAGTLARRFVSVNNKLTGYSPVQPDILYIETVGIDTVQGNGAYTYVMNLPVITITNNGLFLEIAISITTNQTPPSQPQMSFDVEVVSNYSIFV